MPARPRALRFQPVAPLVAAGLTVAAMASPLRSADDRLGYEPVAHAIRGAKVVVAPGLRCEAATAVAQLGPLEPGKRASIVLTAGHILKPTTEVKGLLLDGRPMPPESRHTRLYAKFPRRPAEIRAGVAKPGIEVPDSSSPERPRPVSAGAAGSGR